MHGLLVTKMKIQAFVITLCGLLIYRGAARYYTEDATAGFGFSAGFVQHDLVFRISAVVNQETVVFQLAFDLGEVERLNEFGIKPRHRRLRHSGRADDAVPGRRHPERRQFVADRRVFRMRENRTVSNTASTLSAGLSR
jgi:hypothetical protein